MASGLKRKAVVKTRGVARKKKETVTALTEKAHYHFCSDRDCRLIYMDACDRPEVNDRCSSCRAGRRVTTYMSRDPQECCIGNCQQITEPDVLIRHQLAGPGPWYMCQTCCRAHGWSCQ